MHIVFRTDASLAIGTGHVMRCLTLAGDLREHGARCSFICRPHTGHLLDQIVDCGHQAIALPDLQDGGSSSCNGTAHTEWLGTDWATDAADTQQVLNCSMGSEPLDWLVVDHYALDARWEEALRQQAKRTMVIDDLADRPHACDLLLDQNLGRKAEDYDGLLKCNPVTLIGPKYALLRPEFAAMRPQSLARRQRNPHLRCLLITMGGVDQDNTTGQVLAALQACALPADLRVTVVMGLHAPWLAQVQAHAAQMPWHTEVLVGVNNMAQLMAESDLAIGAAGSTSWERCCLGLPAIQIALAQNQEFIAGALGEAGAAWMLSGQEIASTLPGILAAIMVPKRLQTIAKTCSTITLGQGVKIVSKYMKKLHEDNALVQ